MNTALCAPVLSFSYSLQGPFLSRAPAVSHEVSVLLSASTFREGLCTHWCRLCNPLPLQDVKQLQDSTLSVSSSRGYRVLCAVPFWSPGQLAGPWGAAVPMPSLTVTVVPQPVPPRPPPPRALRGSFLTHLFIGSELNPYFG